MKKPQTDSSIPRTIEPNPLSRAIFRIFGGRAGKTNTKSAFNEEGAKKVDPKLFFANERTFLKWMNVSIWVAAISIGLSSIKTAPPLSLESMSVLIFSALAIIIVIYAMVQCKLWNLVLCSIVLHCNVHHLTPAILWIFVGSHYRRQAVSVDSEAIAGSIRRPIRPDCDWFALCSFVHSAVLYFHGHIIRSNPMIRISVALFARKVVAVLKPKVK